MVRTLKKTQSWRWLHDRSPGVREPGSGGEERGRPTTHATDSRPRLKPGSAGYIAFSPKVVLVNL